MSQVHTQARTTPRTRAEIKVSTAPLVDSQDDRDVLDVELQGSAFNEARANYRDHANQEQEAAHQQGKQSRARVFEAPDLVAKCSKAENKGDGHDKEASDEVSVIHRR